ncbi:MAG: alkaline phosphatase family protein [Deltaproteobacteria bacterium]|nr:alkaline phosphatase family protein [Deltaproteobacteria bacterium]
MKKGFLLVVVLFLTIISDSPTFVHSADPTKVIVISFDGCANQLMQKYLETDFKNKGFGRIAKEGTLKAMQVSLPSLTATSHISIITGEAPGRHGIVSNNFHKTTESILKSTNGFVAEIDARTPALWETAKAQGKRVGVITYPGLDGSSERRTADWGLIYTESESSPFLQTFTKANFQEYDGALPQDIRSYSTPLVATLTLLENKTLAKMDSSLVHHHGNNGKNGDNTEKVKRPFKVLAIDSTNDQTKNYDILIFDEDADLKNGASGSASLYQPWVGLGFQSSGVLKGSWCKLLSFEPDLSRIELYVGALNVTRAYPQSFQDLISDRAGFWPGAPDRKNPMVTDEIILEQALRFSRYLTKVTLLAAKTQKWDLLLAYQPTLDELEHQYYMTDPRQKDYSAEKSKRYLEIIRQGYLEINKAVDQMINELPNTNFVIVSDHGMEPLHSVYYPNRVLAKKGYLPFLTPNEGPDATKIRVRSFSSGGLGHIYINLKGREPDGSVSQSDFQKLKQEVVALFKKESAISQVWTREEAEKLGLNHPNSGDIILVGEPGFHLNDDTKTGEPTEPASFYGQHGYDPSLDSMKAIFGAWGPNIEHESQGSPTQREISYKEVLPFVLNLLKN